jgi:hypothetical protein
MNTPDQLVSAAKASALATSTTEHFASRSEGLIALRALGLRARMLRAWAEYRAEDGSRADRPGFLEERLRNAGR